MHHPEHIQADQLAVFRCPKLKRTFPHKHLQWPRLPHFGPTSQLAILHHHPQYCVPISQCKIRHQCRMEDSAAKCSTLNPCSTD